MTNLPIGLDVAGIVGGMLALGTFIGRGISWLDKRSEGRAQRLERAEEQYVRKLEQRLTALEQAEERHAEQVVALKLAFEIVAIELRRTDPGNSALRRAETLLTAAFPIEVNPPEAIRSLLAKLTDVEGTP